MKKIQHLSLLFWFIACSSSFSQEFNYNNFLLAPLQTNPALISFDDYMKVSIINKSQYTMLNESFSNPNIVAVFPLLNKNKTNKWGGIGASFLSDRVSGSAFTQNYKADFGYAYHFNISERQQISASISASYFKQSINLNKLSTGSQYDPNFGYVDTNPKNEYFSSESKGAFAINSGIMWQLYAKEGYLRAYAGIAGFNLNKPSFSYLENEYDIPMWESFLLGATVFKNNNIEVTPDIYLANKNGNISINVGTRFSILCENWKIIKKQALTIQIEPRYVVNQEVSFGFGIYHPIVGFQIAYNYNLSSKNAINYLDGYEICLTFRKLLIKPKPYKTKSDYQPGDVIVFKDSTLNKDDGKYTDGYSKGYEDALKKLLELQKQNEKEVKINNSILENDSTADIVWKNAHKESSTIIKFDYQKDDLNDKAKTFLNHVAEMCKKDESIIIEIVGHSDNKGTDKGKMKFSIRRAQVVADYLVSQGINANRLRAIGRSDLQPISDNSTDEGRAVNRRVDLNIYKVLQDR